MTHAQARGMWALATELQLAVAEALWLAGRTEQSIGMLQEGVCSVERYQGQQVLRELRQRQGALFEARSSVLPDELILRSGETGALSQRERQVLELIALGHSNQQIADALFISLHTVKTHARRIHGKLGVERRTQAVAKAKLLGLCG
ncbi:hypothetical protein JFT88_20035 [Bacillus sp. TH86]|nr:hypothetical protein [Bacillus sp. TH86]MBK5323260.1 hypothetical protein [Bacillus sp. TH59]MBK5338210.1 hypothetical protein [Bacillus sp. TH57]